MAVAYIGECNSDGSHTGTPLMTQMGVNSMRTKGRTFTAPGTGSDLYDVKELSGWMDWQSAAVPDILVAIYRASDLRLEAEGNAAVISVGGAAWQGHLTAGDITQYHQIVGGTAYILASTDETGTHKLGYYNGSAADSAYLFTGYLSGFADPWPTGGETDSAFAIILRAGLEAAAAAGNPWYHYANQQAGHQ